MFVLVTLADGRHVGLISFGVPLSLLLHVLVQLAAFAERFEAVLEFCLANLALLEEEGFLSLAHGLLFLLHEFPLPLQLLESISRMKIRHTRSLRSLLNFCCIIRVISAYVKAIPHSHLNRSFFLIILLLVHLFFHFL